MFDTSLAEPPREWLDGYPVWSVDPPDVPDPGADPVLVGPGSGDTSYGVPAEPASVADQVPSGWLALDLDVGSADPGELTDAQLIDAAIGWDRIASWASARQARVLAEFSRRRPGDEPQAAMCPTPAVGSRWAPDEVGLALRLSRGAAIVRLDQAVRLTGVLGPTLTLLEHGLLDSAKARAVCDTTALLPAEVAAAVQRQVLPAAPEQTHAQLRAALARAVIAADPRGAADRHRAAQRQRRVRLTEREDGMASLWALLRAPDAIACYEWLSRLARSLGADDPRTMDARRADLLLDLLTGRLELHADDPTEPECAEPDWTEQDLDAAPHEKATPTRSSAAPTHSGDRPVVPEPAAPEPAASVPVGPEATGQRVRPEPAGSKPAESKAVGDAVDESDPTARFVPTGPSPSESHPAGDLVPTGPGRERDRCGGKDRDPGGVDAGGPGLHVGRDSTRRRRVGPRPAPAGKPLVHVTLPFTTLIGADDQPCELAGYGPIPADLAREIAADGVWKRLLFDPLSGAVLDHGRTTYRPPAALADFVRARDARCRFPTCQRQAGNCELDHVQPWTEGGVTADHNLANGCVHHHHTKHQPAGRSVCAPTVSWSGPPRPDTTTSAIPTTTARSMTPTRPSCTDDPARIRCPSGWGTKPRRIHGAGSDAARV